MGTKKLEIKSKYLKWVGTFVFALSCSTISSPAMEQSPPDYSFTYQNKLYVIEQGNAYEVNSITGARTFIIEMFDPEFLSKNYLQKNGETFRIVPDTGATIPILREFSEGFENADVLTDLIGLERGWTSLTLQSQAAPTVAEYVELRRKIFSGQSDFVDNRVEPSPLVAFEGNQSLRTYTPVSKGPVPLTKASLISELLYFAKGDHFWFSAMYFIEYGTPTSLIDLEAEYITGGPGMRLLVSPDMVPRLELKWADKPTYRLNMDVPATLPVGKWFQVELHFFLSDTDEGTVDMWLDGELIISASGKTLPLYDTVLTRLELGITANPKEVASLVYVDQVYFSDTGLTED